MFTYRRSSLVAFALGAPIAACLLLAGASTADAHQQAVAQPRVSTNPPRLEVIPWELNASPSARLDPVAADFNGDGSPEIAYLREMRVFIDGSWDAENLQPNILIRSVNGDTTFTTIAELETFGISVYSVKPVDFNADGLPGILTNHTIHRNSVAGWSSSLLTDELPADYTVIDGPFRFNDDAFPDFLIDSPTGTLISLGDGNGFGAFVALQAPPPPTPSTPLVITQEFVFDFNGDGLDDLALSAIFETDPAVFYVAFHTGNEPGFATATVLGNSPAISSLTLFVPDDPRFPAQVFGKSVDGDTLEFIHPFPPGENPVSELRAHPIPDSRGTYADLDNSGTLDRISGSRLTFDYFLALDLPVEYRVGAVSLAGPNFTLLDINTDGHLDYIGEYGSVLMTQVSGLHPTFGRPRPSRLYNISVSSFLFPTDLNGDKRVDLVGGYNAMLQPPFSEINTTTLYWDSRFPRIGSNAMNMLRASHPAYAHPVLVQCNSVGSPFRLQFVPVDDPESPPVLDVSITPLSVRSTAAVADLDRDRADEIITIHSLSDPSGRILISWTPHEDGYQPAQTILIEDGDPRQVVSGDFDSDGDIDIATTDPLMFFANDGTGYLQPAGTVGIPADTYWLHTTDLNGDGRTDIVGGGNSATSLSEGEFAAYAWIQPESLPMARGEICTLGDPRGVDPWEIYSSDFNRDGVQDLVFIQYPGSYRNVGAVIMTSPLDEANRKLWAIQRIGATQNAGSVADLDNDGHDDIILVNSPYAYFFYSQDLPAIGCEADVNLDGILDLADITAYIERFIDQFYIADFNADQIIDLGDILAFIEAYLEGC